MKNVAIIALLATITAAVPFAKRDVVWTTTTQEVTETTVVTTTIWVDPTPSSVAITSSAAPPATTTESALANQFFEHSSSGSSSSASVTSSSASPMDVPAYTPPSSPSPSPSTSPSSSSSSSAAYIPPPPASPAPTTTAAATSAYVPPPAPTSVAPTTTATEPATPAQGMGTVPVQSGLVPAVGVADTSMCAPGSPCSGDITYYTVGQGSCGITNDGSKENVIALPKDMMGPLSNDNPYCGKTVTIKYKGKTAKAVVADKCGDCKGQSIDLSEVLFKSLSDLTPGRIPGVEWWFN